jgi:hypothetical protein
VTLADAIEGLYGAFAPYRRRDAMDACPCCVRREEQDRLARVPLRTARRRSLEEAFEQHIDDPAASRLAAAVDAWGWMTSGARSSA